MDYDEVEGHETHMGRDIRKMLVFSTKVNFSLEECIISECIFI